MAICKLNDYIIIEIEAAPGHDAKSFFAAYFNKTLKEGDVMRSVRYLKHDELGELDFLREDFIDSLPLAIRSSSYAMYIGWAQPMYLRIIPRGAGSHTLGKIYYNQHESFEEQNPDYYKLCDGFRKAIPSVFTIWLHEDGHRPNERLRSDEITTVPPNEVYEN